MYKARVICNIILVMCSFSCWSQTELPSFINENIQLTKLNINSDQNEYSPMIQGDVFLFTSDHRERFGVYYSSTDTPDKLTGIFIANKTNDTTFTDPELIDNKINRCYNSGPAWLNGEGTDLFFSSNETTKFLFFPSKRKGKLKIYVSKREGKTWSKRVMLPFCNRDFNYTHPYLNTQEDTLYFASDCLGGFGGYDLYFSVLSEEGWSEPTNLGNQINSANNELFPSVLDELFYFSSNRPGSFGGLDVYSYNFISKEIEHLKSPINSISDDFGYAGITKDRAYFSSDREGNDNIYYIKELFPTFKDCEPYEKDPFCFTFFEESDDLEENLNLEYVWSFGDGSKASGKESRHCFADYGEYLVELNIVDRTTSQVFYNQSTYPFTIEHSSRIHLEGQDTIPPSTEIIYTAENSFLDDYEIQNFFWEIDGGKLKYAEVDHITVSFEIEGNHEIKLGAITKSIENGQEVKWCLTKSVFVKKGVEYIESKAETVIADWESSKDASDVQYTLFLGVSDTLLNMTTVIQQDTLKVHPIGDSLFIYSMGISDEKKELLDEFRMAQEMGFVNSQVTELKNMELVQQDKLAHTPTIEVEKIVDNRIKKEQVIATAEVFYDFDVYQLTSRNKQIISQLVSKNTLSAGKKVLISSFTDVKGKKSYNLELSKKRSIAVRDELVRNGFPIEQIELEYFGMRVPESMEPLSDAQRRKSLVIIYE